MKKYFFYIFLFLFNLENFAQNKTIPKPKVQQKVSQQKTTKPIQKPNNQPVVNEQPEEETIVEDGIVLTPPPNFVKKEPQRNYNYKTSDLAVAWHELIFNLIEQTNNYTPNVASRSMAYINLAFYESILPAFSENKSLSQQLQSFKKTSDFEKLTEINPYLTANETFFLMTDKMFETAPYIWIEKVYALHQTIEDSLSKNLSKEIILNSKNYSKQIVSWIYEYSKSDGGHQAYLRTYDMAYSLPICLSCFQINRVADLENTGPLHPNWGKNRTFLKENQENIEIKPKVEFSHYVGSPFYKMAQEVYNISKQVTAGSEKAMIANFWDDAATYTYTAPGHSISILTQYLKQNPDSIEKSAELFSNLSIAISDAFVVTWRLKYQHNLIRPITYIRKYIDSKWEATILTPPFPEFPSGHSAQSATMATVLTSKIGDNRSFVDYSKYFVGPERKFDSFWNAAKECSISRVYGGIHFRDGIEQGEEVGKIVGKNSLKLEYKK